MALTNEQLLAEAEEALHQILTGSRAVRIRTQSGEIVEYNQTDITSLTAYVQSLKGKTQTQAAVGPMHVIF